MVQHLVSRAAGLCAALCIAVTAFAQGLTWVSTTSGGPMGDKTSVAHMYYMPQMVKMVADEGHRVVIFRMDEEKMYTLDVGEKTYTEMTFAELEAMVKRASSKFDVKSEEMRRQLEGMPEDQRKLMEKMLGERRAAADDQAKVSVKKMGQKKQVAGYTANGYTLMRDGKEVLTLWATRDIKSFGTMKSDLQRFNARLSTLNPMWSKGMSEALTTIEGFPLQVEMANGIKTVMSKIETKTTPASEFQVPPGFTKVEKEGPAEEEKD